MEILDYLKLSDEQQLDFMYENGVFVDTITRYDAEYHLFSINNFFVELTTCPVTSQLQRHSPFVDGAKLDKYTSSITQAEKPWA